MLPKGKPITKIKEDKSIDIFMCFFTGQRKERNEE